MDPKEELALRKDQLRTRERKPGFAANIAALKARIAELEAQVNGPV